MMQVICGLVILLIYALAMPVSTVRAESGESMEDMEKLKDPGLQKQLNDLLAWSIGEVLCLECCSESNLTVVWHEETFPQ